MEPASSDCPERSINICPTCAIEHFATCQADHPKSPAPLAVNCIKQFCGVPGEVTLLQLLTLVYRAVAAATCTLTSVTYCLLRLVQYILLLLIYVVENCSWVRSEKRMQYAALKAVAAIISTLFLVYIAYILLITMGQPMLYLLYTLLLTGYSFT